MTEIAATLATVILGGLAVFQLALALGAPLGRYAWGGAQVVLPVKLRIASIISILLYALFAVIILGAAGVTATPVSASILHIVMWVLTGYLALGIIMNGISRSKHERLTMTPVVTVLTILFLYIALR